MKIHIGLCLLILLLPGCINSIYTKHYVGKSAAEIQASPYYETCAEPQLFNLSNQPSAEVIAELYANGYHMVGKSVWNGGRGLGENQALEHAKSIGACRVYVLATPSHHEAGGMFNRVSTIYYHVGVFFVKAKPTPLGALVEEPSSDYMLQMDTRAGALVRGVRKGGAAFFADVFVDDVIMSINGVAVYPDDINDVLKPDAENAIQIYRHGEIITKTVYLSADGSAKKNPTLPLASAEFESEPAATAPGRGPGSFDSQKMFQHLSPSVYVVLPYDKKKRNIGQGSGVALTPNKLLTNCHVIEDAYYITINKNGKRIAQAEPIQNESDSEQDLCMLRVSGPVYGQSTKLNPIKNGKRKHTTLKVGEAVYAVGSPMGLENTISPGIISGLRTRAGDGTKWIQTNAVIAPGSSGGGLFDAQGRLIGITTFITKEAGGLNFAAPVD